MLADIEAHVGGWWDGALHPVEVPTHLIVILLVGLHGGWGVRRGRTSWALPALFVCTMAPAGLLVAALHRHADADGLLVVVAIVLGVLFALPDRLRRVVAPAAAVACGGLHGLAHGTDDGGHPRAAASVAGFTFTVCILLTVGAIVGASAGRAARSRDSQATPAGVEVDAGALV
jgi:urease accessory protein